MLKEVQQQNMQYGRRWLSSEDADLYVWQNTHDEIIGFEYCYRMLSCECSLRWQQQSGFEHRIIDSGEYSPLANNTPLALSVTEPKWPAIIKHFRQQAAVLEKKMHKFIMRKIYEGSVQNQH